MGTDYNLMVFNSEDISRNNLSHILERNKGFLKDLTEDKEKFKHLKIDGIESSLSYIQKLDSEGELKISELTMSLNQTPSPIRRRLNRFYIGKSGKLIDAEIPKFLENNSKEAAQLWKKLTGKNEDTREILIGEEKFKVKSMSGGGFLQGEELERLNQEFINLQPKFSEFYSSLEGAEKTKAERNNILELFLSLSSQPAGTEKATLMLSAHN